MSLDVNEFLNLLEAKTSGNDNIFNIDELTPVVIGKNGPEGQGGGSGGGDLPPSATGPVEVEVLQIEKPKGTKGGKTGKDVKVKDVVDKTKGEKKNKSGEGDEGEAEAEAEGEEGGGKEGVEGGKKKTSGDLKDSGEGAKITKREEKVEGTSGKPDKEHPWGKTIDSHELLGTSDPNEAKEIGEKILEQGEKKRREEGGTDYGDEGGGYLGKLREAYKPKINWVNELKKKLTEFKSRTANAFNRMSKSFSDKYYEGEGSIKSKSYIEWLRNPRSHSQTGENQLISKGPSVKSPYTEAVLIVALDTSGSVPESTISKVFGEMDKIAQSFKAGISTGSVKLTGKVYFMMWDSSVESVEEYKPGDWKKYKEGGSKGVKGFGGTDPGVIFEYINDHIYYDKDSNQKAAVLNLLKKPTAFSIDKDTMVLPIKKGPNGQSLAVAPFLIIATDGYFGQVNESDLGFAFKDNHRNVLWLIIDGTTESIYPDNAIVYETVRV